jgi:hypothetical protein
MPIGRIVAKHVQTSVHTTRWRSVFRLEHTHEPPVVDPFSGMSTTFAKRMLRPNQIFKIFSDVTVAACFTSISGEHVTASCRRRIASAPRKRLASKRPAETVVGKTSVTTKRMPADENRLKAVKYRAVQVAA